MKATIFSNKKRLFLILFSTVAICLLLLGTACFFIAKHHHKEPITFPIADTLPDGNGQKATVILLGGQSNASGCSLDEYLKKNVSPEKYAEYQAGYDNVARLIYISMEYYCTTILLE